MDSETDMDSVMTSDTDTSSDTHMSENLGHGFGLGYGHGLGPGKNFKFRLRFGHKIYMYKDFGHGLGHRLTSHMRVRSSLSRRSKKMGKI